MIYHSKKDWWFVAAMVIVMVILVLQFIWGIAYLLTSQGNAEVGWLSILISAVTVAVIVGVTYPVYYQITSTGLNIRSGVLRWQIPLASIDEVHPTRNPLSSPALSLDRLQIDYRKAGKSRSMMISPEDKVSFMHELVASGTGLELRDGRVIRIR